MLPLPLRPLQEAIVAETEVIADESDDVSLVLSVCSLEEDDCNNKDDV